MRKKIHSILLGLLVSFFTAGCGQASAITNNEVARPAIEDIPQVEQQVTLPETIETTESTIAEQNTTESSFNSETEQVLDESQYFVDGVFYPVEYARQLGYTIYESNGVMEMFSYEHQGTTYFVSASPYICSIYYYGQNGIGYSASIMEPPIHAKECKIATGKAEKENSNDYLKSLMFAIKEVASKDPDLSSWATPGCNYKYGVFNNCSFEYYDNGFIDPLSFDGRDESQSFERSYENS